MIFISHFTNVRKMRNQLLKKCFGNDVAGIINEYLQNKVLYGTREYVVTGIMQESSLLDACSDDVKIQLEMFENEFRLLNVDDFDIVRYLTDSENDINHMYKVLGYFGLETQISELNMHVFYLELFRNPGYQGDALDFYMQLRKNQFSSNTRITEKFFEKNLDKVDWNLLASNISVSESFLARHSDKLNWFYVSRRSNLSPSFLDAFGNLLHVSELLQHKNIPASYYETKLSFMDAGDLRYVSQKLEMTVDFVRRNRAYIDTHYLCLNDSIPEQYFEELVRENFDNVSWHWLCGNRNISEDFFERHIRRVEWMCLCRNKNISEEFYIRHWNHLDWESLSANEGLSEKFFLKYIQYISPKNYCKNRNASVVVLEKFIRYIDWWTCVGNSGIPESFFTKYLMCLTENEWGMLSLSNRLSVNFILDNLVNVTREPGWFHNKNLSVEFVMRYIQQVQFRKTEWVYKLDFTFETKRKYITNMWMIN